MCDKKYNKTLVQEQKDEGNGDKVWQMKDETEKGSDFVKQKQAKREQQADTAIVQSLARKPISNLQAKRRHARLVRRSGMTSESRVPYLFCIFRLSNLLHSFFLIKLSLILRKLVLSQFSLYFRASSSFIYEPKCTICVAADQQHNHSNQSEPHQLLAPPHGCWSNPQIKTSVQKKRLPSRNHALH